MKNLKYLFIPFFLFIITCSLENKTLLSINESNYSVADFQERFQFAPLDDSAKRMEKVSEYVNQMLVVEEAKALGYEEDPVVKTAYATNERDVIWRSYYDDAVVKKVKVSDSEVRALYDKIVEQYHLAQIVVAEESLANHVENELKKGISFEDLLVYSLDTISENGDIGTFSVVSIPPEIMQVLKNVKTGGVTEPIKFGEYYMIFKVVEHSTADKPSFEEVKENIRNNLWQDKARQAGEEYYNKLMSKARVEYNEEGLAILSKPDSLITEKDLNTWVVKKYDTSYVYVRSVIDAVRYLRSSGRIDPKYLIDQELVPDLVYDEAIRNYHDKRQTTKRKLRNTYNTLLYQKYYSDMITEKAVVDSNEVVLYYRKHRDEFNGKDLSQAFSIAKARVRDARVESLRDELFAMLHEKYQPEINEAALAQLLKEEK
jgi:parvulin-like peptidyl-prolyl isomerase